MRFVRTLIEPGRCVARKPEAARGMERWRVRALRRSCRPLRPFARALQRAVALNGRKRQRCGECPNFPIGSGLPEVPKVPVNVTIAGHTGCCQDNADEAVSIRQFACRIRVRGGVPRRVSIWGAVGLVLLVEPTADDTRVVCCRALTSGALGEGISQRYAFMGYATFIRLALLSTERLISCDLVSHIARPSRVPGRSCPFEAVPPVRAQSPGPNRSGPVT
jgi:hypothetical protein